MRRRHKNKKERKKFLKKKDKTDTHTLRQLLGSKPGGRFPLGIGSICKNVKRKEKKK